MTRPQERLAVETHVSAAAASHVESGQALAVALVALGRML
jgi:hypothetical protein